MHERICEEDREETSHCKADGLNLEKIVMIIRCLKRNIEMKRKTLRIKLFDMGSENMNI